MSVIIKGMEMPKNCYACQLCDEVEAFTNEFICYCTGKAYDDVTKYADRRPEWCPLEEVKEEKDWALKTSDQKQTSR